MLLTANSDGFQWIPLPAWSNDVTETAAVEIYYRFKTFLCGGEVVGILLLLVIIIYILNKTCA